MNEYFYTFKVKTNKFRRNGQLKEQQQQKHDTEEHK